jgi:hypothetical protein
MIFSRHWIFFRFLMPVLLHIAGGIPNFIWHGSTIGALFLSALVLGGPLINFSIGMSEAPVHEPQQNLKSFRTCRAVWLASEILTLLILSFTEIGALATFHAPHPDPRFDIFIVCSLFLGPYTLLVLFTRNRLGRCYELLAEDIEKGYMPTTRK